MFKKILLINPFGIGDVLFTTPIIHSLKDAFGDIKIGYLCNRRALPVLENNPFIDSIFIYERDEFDQIRKKSFLAWIGRIVIFLDEIKNEHFDAVLDFSLNTQYSFFSWYAGIRKRIGYDYKQRGWLLTQKIKLDGYREKHIVEYYADLLKFLGVDLQHKNLEFYLKEEDGLKISKFLEKEGIRENDLLIGIIPGAGRSWGKDSNLKHWPVEKYAQLADKLVENYKAKIIIMGDSSEKEITKSLIQGMHYEALDLTGETSIGELAVVLSKVNLLVTNDGGPMHIAVALGTKTISFFGPVDFRVYGPFPNERNQHTLLKKELTCSPCYNNFRLSPCMMNKECLNSISVDEAFEAAKGFLH